MELVQLVVKSYETVILGVAYLSPLEQELQKATFYYVPGYEDDPEFIYGRWDGKEQLMQRYNPTTAAYQSYKGACHTLPTGLLPKVLNILAARGVDYSIENKIPKWVKDPKMAYLNGAPPIVRLRGYQASAVKTLISPSPVHNKQIELWKKAFGNEPIPAEHLATQQAPRLGGILQAGTGAGKTICAAKLIQVMQVPTVFLVNQKDLMGQTIRELKNFLGCEIGQVGGGKMDIKDVTVATVQTVCKAKDADPDAADTDSPKNDRQKRLINQMMGRAGLVIVDEAHGVAAPTAQAAVSMAQHACCVVGLSASPWRDDGMDILIEAACGPVVYKVSASDLITEGYLVQPEIQVYILPNPEKYTRAHSSSRFHELYGAWVVNDTFRNTFIANKAQEFMFEGQVVIVLVKQIEHGETLQKLIPSSVFLEGSLGKTKREDILKQVRNGEILCLIATSLADQGLDIPVASVVILAGGGKSSTKALQRIGRVLRKSPGKTRAYVVDIVDNHNTFKRHFAERQQIYKSEPRFEIRKFHVDTQGHEFKVG